MSRQYQKKQHLLEQIRQMLASGMTQREVEEELGLTGYRPVHELLKRERRKEIPGMPKTKGRPRTRPLTTEDDYKKEISRLQMENKLLRDFLRSTERK
ncbi:MAG: imidazolonepropionase [Ruminiclostridium sp.]|nr:imidazolonepropionase [Ruminiclostridium sp.]